MEGLDADGEIVHAADTRIQFAHGEPVHCSRFTSPARRGRTGLTHQLPA
jgi:hypothetical protein